jgi:hypothetical protein
MVRQILLGLGMVWQILLGLRVVGQGLTMHGNGQAQDREGEDCCTLLLERHWSKTLYAQQHHPFHE